MQITIHRNRKVLVVQMLLTGFPWYHSRQTGLRAKWRYCRTGCARDIMWSARWSCPRRSVCEYDPTTNAEAPHRIPAVGSSKTRTGRIVNHRLGHHQAEYTHAARQTARGRVGHVHQFDHIQKIVGDPLPWGHAVQARLKPNSSRGKERIIIQLCGIDTDRAVRAARVFIDIGTQTQTSPSVLIVRPARMLINVDLPAPLGPSNPNSCHARDFKIDVTGRAVRLLLARVAG